MGWNEDMSLNNPKCSWIAKSWFLMQVFWNSIYSFVARLRLLTDRLTVSKQEGFFQIGKGRRDHSKHFIPTQIFKGNRSGSLPFVQARRPILAWELVVFWKARKRIFESLTMKLSILLLSMFTSVSVRVGGFFDFWCIIQFLLDSFIDLWKI